MKLILNKFNKLLEDFVKSVENSSKETQILEEKISKLKENIKEIEKDIIFFTENNLKDSLDNVKNIEKRLTQTELEIKKLLELTIKEIDLKKIEDLRKKIKMIEERIDELNKKIDLQLKQLVVPVGSSSYSLEVATFVLFRESNAQVGVNLTNALIVPRRAKIVKAFAFAGLSPMGSDLIFDIHANFQSLWYINPNNKLRIPAWEFYGFTTNFDIVNLNEGDVLTINIDQVGLFLPGGDITVELLMLLKP